MAAAKRPTAEFTVLLEVRVVGPDDDWEIVARRLARKTERLTLPGGYRVVSAQIDTASELVEDGETRGS